MLPAKRARTTLPLTSYTQQLAHIFGDPLLRATGLEGGHLDSALSLMANIIKQALLPKFPQQRGILNKLIEKLERCYEYCSALKLDRETGGKSTLAIISEDIIELAPLDWLIIPGGWQAFKTGHAMLYIILKKAVREILSA